MPCPHTAVAMRAPSCLLLGCFLAACGGESAVVDPGTGSGGSRATAGSGGSDAATSSSGGGTTTTGGGGAPVTCSPAGLVPGETELTISFDGNERTYDVQVPASYDNSAPVPLVLDLHGFTSSKEQQEAISGWNALAEAEGFVVVRPDGWVSSWNAGGFCCGTAQNLDLDDVGLMRAIVAEIQRQLCIDPKRIYATGLSNGGAMSHRLACEAADLFAAVAPVSYPLDFSPFSGCQPSRPIAVMHSHGVFDTVVPYNGSLTAPATPDSFAYWAEVNGCTGDPVETYEQDGSTCETYESCDAGVEVRLCTIDGGHVLYSNLDSVPVAGLAWDFFEQHSLP